jgi:hypothetical protein
MKQFLLLASIFLVFTTANAQTIETSTGDFEVTCKRSWQECKLCGQKKDYVYRVKNNKYEEEKTVEHCVEWYLIALTNRLHIQFELGRKMTMIYPEFTETVNMAPDECAESTTGKHSFLTKTEDFIEKWTAKQQTGCENNPEIK